MNSILNFFIPKAYAALSCLPGIEPENYEIKHFEQLALCFSQIFFVALIPVAVIMLIWGAFQYLTAYGNEEKAQRGKTIIIWSIWGLVVAFLAWVIIGELWRLLLFKETGPLPGEIPIDKWP